MLSLIIKKFSSQKVGEGGRFPSPPPSSGLLWPWLHLKNKNPDQLKLPIWVNVKRKRFDEILSTITKAKNNGLKTSVDGRKITLDNAESLPKCIGSWKINGSEFKKSKTILLMMWKQYYRIQCSQEVKIKW